MSEPHWLIQELAGNAAWTAVGFGAAYAWKYREAIATKLRRSIPQTLHVYGIPSQQSIGEPTITAGASAQLNWSVRGLAGKSIDLRWNVESPTPSLARRLEELAAWYLHVS